MKNVIEFLEDNKVELFKVMIELDIVDEDDVNDGYDEMDDYINLVKGSYYDKDENFYENVEDVCNVTEGFDVSFKRKYVKDIFGDAEEIMINIGGKKLYGLVYSC
jgi:hypothetical protein